MFADPSVPTSCGCEEYQRLSRRSFMARSSAFAPAAAAVPAWLPRVSLASSHRSAQRDVLVVVFLRGAADALSLCVPHAEDNYYAQRPTIAIPRPDSGSPFAAIDIGGGFGFPQSMASLMPAYTDGNLLVAHAVGIQNATRSHFDAQRFLEVGLADAPDLASGWLARHLLSTEPQSADALVRAIGVTAGLPQILHDAPGATSSPALEEFGIRGRGTTTAHRTNALAGMYSDAGEPLLHHASAALDTLALLTNINFSSYTPYGGASYPNHTFSNALKSTAALIKAQIGVEAIAIDVTGWDTHNAQGSVNGALASLMRLFAESLAAFHTDMNDPNAPSYTLLAISEFGRRVQENQNQGTDHGTGSCMFVMGPCVNGGRVLSDWPGLAPEQLYEGIDLAATIDSRDIFAEVISSRLGNTNLPFVFPEFTPTQRGVFSC